MVAGAAGNLALALSEFQDCGLTTHTKMAGGDAIFQLFRLRQMMVGTWDFDRIAREQGVTALRTACDGEIRPEIADMLVDSVIEILRKVTRDQLN
jgi:hypothetical protein